MAGNAEQPQPNFVNANQFWQENFREPDRRTPREIIESGEALTRLETIPIANVIVEKPLVDPDHAADLGLDIVKKGAQLMPILVRVRQEEGELVYDIADGFHRTVGMKNAGLESIEAKVRYQCDDAELIDTRIFSANSVKSVKFGRIALWMNDSYQRTEWSTMGISLGEAVGAALFNSNEVNGHTFTPSQMTRMKEWFEEKSNHWQMPLEELWGSIGIIEQSDPILVNLVRPEVEKGQEGVAITERHLKAVTDFYPGKNNYGIQRALIVWGMQNKATDSYLEKLSEEIMPNIEDYRKTHNGNVPPKASQITPFIENAHERLDRIKLETARKRESNRRAAREREARLATQNNIQTTTVEKELNQSKVTNEETKATEIKANIPTPLAEINPPRATTWEVMSGLTEDERIIMTQLFDKGTSLVEIASAYGVENGDIAQIIISALEKRDQMKA